jgi:hypothetical protein
MKSFQKINMKATMIGLLLGITCAASMACSDEEQTESTRLDPVFVDYVAPTNGDAFQSAQIHFEVGIARARSDSISECLKEQGFVADDSVIVLRAEHDAKLTDKLLPPLADIAKHGLIRVAPPEVRNVSDDMEGAITECSDTSGNGSIEWTNAVGQLRREFYETVLTTIKDLETGTAWATAKECLVNAGAPTDPAALVEPPPPGDAQGTSANTSTEASLYHSWVFRTEMERVMNSTSSEPPPASAEAKAYSSCVSPFFDEVAKALDEPRSDLVERQRERLTELQEESSKLLGESND